MKTYFEITINDLQLVTIWAAQSAEKALGIYETINKEDNRPRRAIEGAKAFFNTGKRNNTLRKLALDSYRASNETKDKAAAAAAKSASLAAASAFTHPFKDIRQAQHILGPAVYAALAIELFHNDKNLADKEITHAINSADNKIAILLSNFPEQPLTEKRINQLFYKLDQGIREKI